MRIPNFGRYRGYMVDIRPYRLRTGEWCAEFDLARDEGGSLLVTGFFGSGKFLTENEAIRGAVCNARRTIEAGFSPVVT